MKIGTWRFLGAFILCSLLLIVIFLQNLGAGSNGLSLLRMKSVALPKILIWTSVLGLFQGVFLTLFLKNFFTTMNTPELKKFDLEPSL
ncbi:MAG: hypothetical protein DLD55_02635 [candidate division SR1 bacterium]|nr:MAG: hypothetical protein DLD55_02635 [candidate division SR1 bacterium]